MSEPIHLLIDVSSFVPFAAQQSASRGEIRKQFAHVADIAPIINNVPQSPMQGNSQSDSFAAPQTPSRAKAQYFEMCGNRGCGPTAGPSTHRTG